MVFNYSCIGSAYLTQTRKFAVLDRSMEEFTNEELVQEGQLSNGNNVLDEENQSRG